MVTKATIRTPETEARYAAERRRRPADYGCPLCKAETVKDFTYWRIVRNDFPYDLIAKQHDMILSKRHVTEHELTEDEKAEYATIKDGYAQEQGYNYIAEATHDAKSIPAHHHIHLVTLRDDIWERIASPTVH